MPIQAYFHCKTCHAVGRKDKLSVGMSDPQTLTVHCDACDQHVGNFKLAEPMRNLQCGVCDGVIGPNHVH